MQRLGLLIFSVAVLAVAAAKLAAAAPAPTDSRQALEAARAAYQAGNFDQARDLALKASQTDPKNPEAHLLLGMARYQLGELDEAIAAWKRTLQLAPEEPYAKKMLAVLRGQAVAIDTRIKLIEEMLRERLLNVPLQECKDLLADKALSDAQRAKVMTLQAEILIRKGKHGDANVVLQTLLALYPQQADPLQTTLLLGQAKLRGDEESRADAVKLLGKLIADHPDTPAAKAAQYELAIFELQKGVEPARVEALANWLAANKDHELANDARRRLLVSYLQLTTQGSRPSRDADLSPTDVKALGLAAELCRPDLSPAEAGAFGGPLIEHIQKHYLSNGAQAAALKATETLLGLPLPRPWRLQVLELQASCQLQIATRWLGEEATAGRLPQAAARGQLPQKLADLVGAYATIRQEYPNRPCWPEQATLASVVWSHAVRVLPSAEFKGLCGPEAWALDIAMPVVKTDADPGAVQGALATVQAIITARAQSQNAESRKLAVELSGELLAAVSASHSQWSAILGARVQLLGDYAAYLFQENIKAGKAEENAKLSEPQKQMLAAMAAYVAHDAQYAPAALAQLTTHLQRWISQGHWAVAEEAIGTLAKALPETQRRQADLAVARLWIDQVVREHQQLAAAGLTVPRQLDPRLAKALERCCQLQAGLAADPALLAQVRAVCDTVVGHYEALEYYDVAEAAIQVKAEKSCEEADEYATFQLALLKEEQARRELQRLLGQYGASEKISLSPAFKEVLAAWTKFIDARPTSTLVPQATERVFGIGGLFEQQKAYAIAAAVYGQLAEFARGVEVLSQSAPGTCSTAQRAAFAMATALDAQARENLAKQMADRQADTPPPTEPSKEFVAAIAAYQAFIKAYPDSPLVGPAIGKVMAVAYQYASIDAWDVADAIYAGLLSSELAIRRPERLEFCRGLCQLGRAMPEHAREILRAMGQWPGAAGERGRAGGDEAMLAMGGLPGGGRMPAGPVSSPEDKDLSAPALADRLTSREAPPQTPASAPVTLSNAAGMLPPPAQPPPADEPNRDAQLLAMIRRQESNRAAQVAQLRQRLVVNQAAESQVQRAAQQGVAPPAPVLSEAELARQDKALGAAYEIFQGIRKDHPHTATAEQARGEILVMVGHWRGVGRWERSAALALRFLADNPADQELPKIRLEIARDRLSWATRPIDQQEPKQQMLAEVAKRFEAARAELATIVADFPKELAQRQEAQWEIANSYLSQARVVDALSPTLARGQYVRAAKELRQVAKKYPNHPRIGTIPDMLWSIAAELEGRGYDEEAILVWDELTIYDPLHPLAQQAALKIAETYHQKLKRHLRAAEAYQELNFARGGGDQGLQNAIFQIGSELKNEKRWVEALHVLDSFVDSFPRNPQAGQGLTMIGQIHQTNEAWEDAIAAYRRVIAEFSDGQFVQEAKWAIAECTINLSRWQEASEAYRAYVAAYPNDARVPEANRRIEVLKDLARYQGLVDEKGQRKAFDAQYQIAAIVGSQLSNPVKSIIEYRKVVANWPDSHLADDALYAVGTTYLNRGETQQAREALLQVAQKYPSSPLADDALYMVGKSYEDEATRLATVTRESTLAQNTEVAQRRAYEMARSNVSRQLKLKSDRIASLKKEGKGGMAEAEEASAAANYAQFNEANVKLSAQRAIQEVAALTATQLADRQDKINAALRKAVQSYTSASKVPGADKADEALLQMATIYDQQLKDSQAAMQTWLEIVRQFSGTSVAEDASWRIAQHYEREAKYAEAIDAYQAFLRNYRRSPKAGEAQFAVAEDYEHLGQWVSAMDSYTNYITNFPDGPLVKKAQDQINWIKTYRL